MIELALAAALMAQDSVIVATQHVSRDELETLRPDFMDGWSMCDQLEADRPHTDCALQTDEGREFNLFFAFSAMDDGREMIDLSIHNFDGILVQTMAYATESFFYPSLIDLNGDGMEELLVPIMTGNVNTTYSLSIGSEYGFELTASELNGYGVDSLDDGLFKVSARGSAIAHYIEFYRVDGTSLENVASVELSFGGMDDADDGPNCRLINGGEELGEAHYCGLAMQQ